MNQSKVIIECYEVEASIGVFEWEKEIPQNLQFDLQLHCDFSLASQSDCIDDAIDYAEICMAIDKVVATRHFDLLESLAECVAEHLFNSFAIQRITIGIRKPGAVQGAAAVGVEIVRTRPDRCQ